MTYTDLITATLPERNLLMIDGAGSTDCPAFGAAIGALFATRAGLGGGDAPLEGTYRQRGGGEFDLARSHEWLWTLAVPAPDGVESLDGAPAPDVRLARQPLTRVVQAMHHGPYEGETTTLAALQAEASTQGLTISGPHTERYLTDPRSTPPDHLRTLLWYPVSP